MDLQALSQQYGIDIPMWNQGNITQETATPLLDHAIEMKSLRDNALPEEKLEFLKTIMA